MITITDDTLRELARVEIARQVVRLEWMIREEISRTLQLVDEKRGIELLAIKGKDPRRTFRRLMNRHRVQKIQLGSLRGWKLSAIEELIR
jgi:hypothetical protein